jgi:hypothetical protein
MPRTVRAADVDGNYADLSARCSSRSRRCLLMFGNGEEFECARSSVDRAENGEPVPVGSCDRVLRAAHVLAGQNGLPACPVSSLRLLPTRGSPSMTGEMAAIFILLDRSTTTCAVGGYPNIALYTARGERLPFRFRDAAGRT